MANLQAIGIDGLTVIYLWADGLGTNLDPFKSKFLAVQSGDWSVELGATTLSALENIGVTVSNTPTVNIGTINGIATEAKQGDLISLFPSSLGAKTPSNSLSVTQAYAATSTLSNVASSASSVSLLAINNNRKTAIIHNDSTSILYVCLNASTASTSNFSFKLQPDGIGIVKGEDYSGEIRGIWVSTNGFARITEVV